MSADQPGHIPGGERSDTVKEVTFEVVEDRPPESEILRIIGWALCGLGAIASLVRPKVGAPMMVVGATLALPGERHSQRQAASNEPLRARQIDSRTGAIIGERSEPSEGESPASESHSSAPSALENDSSVPISPRLRDRFAADFRRRFPDDASSSRLPHVES